MDTCEKPTIISTPTQANGLDEVTVHIPDRQRDHMRVELEHFAKSDLHDPDARTWIKICQTTNRYMPEQALEKLAGLRSDSGELGIVLLRNMPLDKAIPRTPAPTQRWHNKSTGVSEASHLVVHAGIGTYPISYFDENGGDTTATLFAKRGDETEQVSSGQQLLELHGENQFHEFPPDILTISCLQENGSGSVATIIASARRAIPLLSCDELMLARQPIFSIRAPYSFVGIDTASAPGPMIYGSDDNPQLRFDAHAMFSNVPEGQRLINTMRDSLMASRIEVFMRRGDMLVIDNRAAAHGRTDFQADFTQLRITQRTFGRFDLAAANAIRRSHSTILGRACAA